MSHSLQYIDICKQADMFETSEEDQEELRSVNEGNSSYLQSPLDSSKRSLVEISDDDSEAEANMFDMASQSLDKTKRGRPVITRQLFQQIQKHGLVSER